MKRVLWLTIALLMLLSVSTLPVAAIDPGEGMTFDESEFCTVTRPYEDFPRTFEAWVYVPKEDGTRQGVIMGNLSGSAPCINFEITTGGKPRLYVIDGDKNKYDLIFSGADVRTGDWAHVAIVYDAVNGKADCYINGTLRATKDGITEYDAGVIQNAFVLAGDHRSGNVQYFKGTLRSVSLFTNVRTPEQIKEDMLHVKHTDPTLLAHYDLTSEIVDDTIIDDGNGMYDVQCVRTWFTDKEPVTDYAYSFCVVGDTQKITYNEPDKLRYIYDWIVANKDEKKISYVFGLGDITDKDLDEEWAVAKEQIEKLNGVVPYSLIRGNHDSSKRINATFANETYMGMFEGFYDPNKIETSWTTFRAGEVDYLHITLDYGPNDAELAWASDVIEAHPDHRVIITTHAYLYRDGTTLDEGDEYPPRPAGSDNGKNNGDDIWEKLIRKHENIFMVLSGHDPCSNVIVTQTKGDHGNVVTQMLIDPQGVDGAEGATGLVAMLYFSNDGKTVSVEYYSTVREQYYMSTSQMDIRIPAYAPASDETAEAEPDSPESMPSEETEPSEKEEEPDSALPLAAIVLLLSGSSSAAILASRQKRKKLESKKEGSE